jgi:hypothetical protein
MPVAEALLAFLERNSRQLTAQSLASQWQRDHPDQAEFRLWLARITSGPATEPGLTAVPRP